MEADFWHNRWRDNAIPFHKAETNPSLEKHFHNLGLDGAGDVFVPLCGKSVDMCWLREQGCTVTGVELSDIAVRDFFAEQGMAAESRREGAFEILEADGIRLLCGDFFALEPVHTANASAVYDRAALIALPPDLRSRYVEHLHAIVPARAPMLLLTFEYPPHETEGPPFSVDVEAVRALYAGKRQVTLLESADRLADEARLAERGITRLQEHAFLLTAA